MDETVITRITLDLPSRNIRALELLGLNPAQKGDGTWEMSVPFPISEHGYRWAKVDTKTGQLILNIQGYPQDRDRRALEELEGHLKELLPFARLAEAIAALEERLSMQERAK